MFAHRRAARFAVTCFVFAALAGTCFGASPASAQDTRVRLDSEPGGWPGNQHLDVVPTATTLKSYSSRAFGIDLYLSGFGPTWRFRFGQPNGIAFGPGVYSPAAQSYPMGDMPSIQLEYNSSYTSTPTGSFEIRKVTWNSSSNLASLWVVFRFTGANRFGPGLNGEIRWNADTSLYIRNPRVALALTSDTLSVPIAGIDTRGRPVTLAASPLPAGATLVPTGPGAAVIRWPATPATEGVYAVRITATNDQGLQDTSTTFIRVVHPFQMSLRGAAGDLVTQGITTVLQRADATVYKSAGQTFFGMDIHSWYKQWDWDFVAPAGGTLTEGTHTALQLEGRQFGDETGLLVANGRSCPLLSTGTLRLRRYRFAPDGSLSSLWAEVEQTCHGSTGGLVGELRYHADTTIDVQAPALAVSLRGQPVHFDVTSLVAGPGTARLSALSLPVGATFLDRGDGTGAFDWPSGPPTGSTGNARFVATAPSGAADTIATRMQSRTPFRAMLWNGYNSYPLLYRPWFYEAPAAHIAFAESADSSLTVTVEGQGHSWTFTFSAPAGRRLTTGVYDPNDPDRRHVSPHARFRFGHEGLVGGADTRFHIRRLARAPDGSIRSFWATFRSSAWPGEPPDSGEVRFDVDTTLYVAAPGEVARPAGNAFHFDARAFDVSGAAVHFSLLSAPAGAVLADHGDATAGVDVPATGLPLGRAPVVLRTVSESGACDTTTIVLRALAPALLTLESDWTDPVAMGEGDTLREVDAAFAVETAQLGGVSATIGATEHMWRLDFWGPDGKPLTPGVYEQATSCGGCLYVDGHPHMDVTMDARSCAYSVLGAFDVRRLRRAPDGSVRSLWVTFERTCSSSGAVRGGLLWNADTSVYLRAPAYVTTETRRATSIAATAVDTRGLAVSFAATQLPAGATLLDHLDGSATVEWPAGPADAGTYPVTWIATSSDGQADTLTTTIEAFRTALFTIQSAPADPVGGGAVLRFTGADGAVTSAVWSDSTLEVTFRGQGRVLGYVLGAPFARSLREGVFGGARLYGANQSDQPALTVSVDGRTCAIDSASFHVRHLERSPSGALRSLWMTFAQRCKGASTVMTGEVRVTADTALYIEAPAEVVRLVGEPVAFAARAVDTRGRPVTLAAAELPGGATFTPGPDATGQLTWNPDDAPGAVRRIVLVAASDDGRVDTVVTCVRTFAPDFLRMASVSGDYIGLGKTYDLRATSGRFSTRRSGSAIELNWNGLHEDWSIQVAAPFGRPPAQGHYDPAGSTRTRTLPQSGIDISTTGRADATKHGQFHIRKLQLDAAGEVRSIWMTFESSLTAGPGISGEVWLGSPDTTGYLDGPADRCVTPSTLLSYTVAARGALAADVHWTLLAAPPGTTLIPSPNGTVTVHWSGGATPGDFPVRLLATGASGSDSLTTWLHVPRPSYVDLQADPIFFLPQGVHHRFDDCDATYSFWRNSGNNAVSVVLSSPGYNGHWDFSRAGGAKIVPGSYPVTGSIPPWGTSPNGIYCVWNSLVLGVKSGQFDVWEATYSPTDSLLSFVATFRLVELNTTVPFTGEIHMVGTDLPVPVQLSLIDATWTGDAVRLRWLASGEIPGALRVQRTADGVEWTDAGTPVFEGEDRLVFEDHSAPAASRCGYRLVATSNGSPLGEIAWVDVPAPARLDLQRLGPNPGHAPLEFALTAPRPGPATLEVLDVSGRVLDRRQWDALPAGRTLVTLDGLRSLPPGCYFVRLAISGTTVSRSYVVLR